MRRLLRMQKTKAKTMGSKNVRRKQTDTKRLFLTLTIDDKSYKQLKQKYNLKDDNDIATKAIRLCLERVRKQTGKSVKHWFITEMGHEKTERPHLS